MTLANTVTTTARTKTMMATGFINKIAVDLGQWVALVIPYENKRLQLKEELKKVEAEIAKHSTLKNSITRFALKFWVFASRNRSNFLSGVSKTVRTGAGSFSWKLNSVSSFITDNEEQAITEIERLGTPGLIVKSIDREAVKAAYLAGKIKSPKSFRVEQLERLVIEPVNLPSVTVYPDGRVDFACE